MPLASSSIHPLGALLREWRDRRGCSQLDLSLQAGVSQRHISFVETGRSAPSRALLIALANALDIPFRERNALLLAAGFAPAYADADWNADEMRTVRRALERMLKQHEPWPALVMDRHWNVLMTNDAAPDFFGRFIDLAAHPKPRNLLRLMFDPAALRPFVHDWDAVAAGLLERIRREATGGVVDAEMQRLQSALRDFGGAGLGGCRHAPASTAPFVPVGFVLDGRVLNYFSMVSTIGTPGSIAAQELRLECMFPADDATEAWHAEALSSPHRSMG